MVRIHTNTLSAMHLIHKAQALGLVVMDITKRGSRSHERAFEIKLSGTSPYRSMSNEYQAASWDEWGLFMEQVYRADDTAHIGDYGPHYVFEEATVWRFETLELADQHRRHKWQGNGPRMQVCDGCGAERDFQALDVWQKSRRRQKVAA